jgi:ABC-type sugar transport system substrate-binding protein
MEAAPLGAGVESYRPGRADTRVRAGHDPPAARLGGSLEVQKTGSGDRTRGGVQVAQDRLVSPSASTDVEVEGTVEQAIHALKGEPVQKKIGTGFVVVTKDNMNNPDVQPFLYKSSC